MPKQSFTMRGTLSVAEAKEQLKNEGYQVGRIYDMKTHYTAEVRKIDDVEKDPNTQYHFKMVKKVKYTQT